MSIPFPVPTLHPAPRLTVDRLHAVLETRGFQCAIVLLAGAHSLAPGCTVSLQFGDRIAIGAGGAMRLTIRCSVQINGGEVRARGVTYWQIRRLVSPPSGSDGLGIAIEADLILGGEIGLSKVPARVDHALSHLRRLIADARDTLRDLPIDDRPGRCIEGSAVRIEAKFLGDLAAGRSGLVVSREPRIAAYSPAMTTDHKRMTRAACNWLDDEVLPELAQAVRSMIPQAGASIQSPSEASSPTATQPPLHA
jgi:hypothetical protein